jgi:hypothetical protein
VFSSSPVEEQSKAIIENKRIGRDLILTLLASHLAELIVPHTSQPLKAIDLPVGHHVLEKKMAVRFPVFICWSGRPRCRLSAIRFVA